VAHPDTERDALSETRSRIQRAADRGVEANARLTGSIAAVLLVLLAAEGLTILRVGRLLTWHVFLGMVLVPPSTAAMLPVRRAFVWTPPSAALWILDRVSESAPRFASE